MPPVSTRLRIAVGAAAACCVVSLSLLLILHAGVRGFVLDPIVHGINGVRGTLNHMSQALQWLIALLIVSLFVIGYVASRLPKRRARARPLPRPSRPKVRP